MIYFITQQAEARKTKVSTDFCVMFFSARLLKTYCSPDDGREQERALFVEERARLLCKIIFIWQLIISYAFKYIWYQDVFIKRWKPWMPLFWNNYFPLARVAQCHSPLASLARHQCSSLSCICASYLRLGLRTQTAKGEELGSCVTCLLSSSCGRWIVSLASEPQTHRSRVQNGLKQWVCMLRGQFFVVSSCL